MASDSLCSVCEVPECKRKKHFLESEDTSIIRCLDKMKWDREHPKEIEIEVQWKE